MAHLLENKPVHRMDLLRLFTDLFSGTPLGSLFLHQENNPGLFRGREPHSGHAGPTLDRHWSGVRQQLGYRGGSHLPLDIYLSVISGSLAGSWQASGEKLRFGGHCVNLHARPHSIGTPIRRKPGFQNIDASRQILTDSNDEHPLRGGRTQHSPVGSRLLQDGPSLQDAPAE